MPSCNAIPVATSAAFCTDVAAEATMSSNPFGAQNATVQTAMTHALSVDNAARATVTSNPFAGNVCANTAQAPVPHASVSHVWAGPGHSTLVADVDARATLTAPPPTGVVHNMVQAPANRAAELSNPFAEYATTTVQAAMTDALASPFMEASVPLGTVDKTATFSTDLFFSAPSLWRTSNPCAGNAHVPTARYMWGIADVAPPATIPSIEMATAPLGQSAPCCSTMIVAPVATTATTGTQHVTSVGLSTDASLCHSNVALDDTPEGENHMVLGAFAQRLPKGKQSARTRRQAKRPPATPTPMRKEQGSPRKRSCIPDQSTSAMPLPMVMGTPHPNTRSRGSPGLNIMVLNQHHINLDTKMAPFEFEPVTLDDDDVEI